jgi:murein DD-endopeptidase MepM/ murein hydrolase activator NlpD
MSLQQKNKNTAGGGLYIALAICVLSVICIGVYSAILNIFQDPIPVLPSENENGENKGPTVIINPSDSPEQSDPTPNLPVTAPPNPVDPDLGVDSKPTPPSYTLPVSGGISKHFSNDTLVYSETMNDYRVHNGVDLVAPVGTQVKAFTDGVVKEIFEDPLMGQTVILQHENDTVSIYQNLSFSLPEGITVGAAVKEGQVIAGVGETILIECAEVPHLHFEVTVNGKHVDPLSYFS